MLDCGAVGVSRTFLSCESCKSFQPVHTSVDYFHIFGLEKVFEIEDTNLEKTYKEWQKKLIHPDLVHTKFEIWNVERQYLFQELDEEPNPNFYKIKFLILEYLNAAWELARSLIMGYTHGPEYKEGWFCIFLRLMGLALPGISAHYLERGCQALKDPVLDDANLKVYAYYKFCS
ncbi:hypothetical protein MKW92_047611 [Papaver armeniacum]|nr:hypothetical protein MKW92_047611 [Papaver armeniacum]